jgi:hypothetical protein
MFDSYGYKSLAGRPRTGNRLRIAYSGRKTSHKAREIVREGGGGKLVGDSVNQQLERLLRTEFQTLGQLAEAASKLKVRDYKVSGNAGAYRIQVPLKGGGREKKRKKRSGKGTSRVHTTRVPRSVKLAPDKMVVDLQWRSDSILVGGTPTARRWYTNGAFDVDPTLGNKSINGFNTWSTIYAFNRVLSYAIDMTLVNVEATPVWLDFVHLNTDPGTGGTSYPMWATQSYGHSRSLGASGGIGTTRYTAKHSIRQIVGDRMPITSDRYVGSSSANPTDLTYFGVCVRDPITSLSNGVAYMLLMTLRIEFFDRQNIDDT